MYYFDHAATTEPYAEVVETMSEVMQKYYGNPSSLHRLGLEAERLLYKSRENTARLLNVKPEEIIFTSGGTESNNMAVKGVALKYQHRGKHLITTQIEHPSTYDCFKQLERYGFDVTYVMPDETGAIRAEDIRKEIRDDTILISVMHVNNETGRIQPIEEIGSFVKHYRKILFHVDGVQAVGKLPVIMKDLGIDLYSISAHKFGGPRGAGILVKKSSADLDPLLSGGGQESGYRSGTENVAAIVGMTKALRMSLESLQTSEKHMRSLKDRLIRGLENESDFILNTVSNGSAPHIINVSIPGIKSEVMLHALEKHKIFISTRSACSSSQHRPSRILEAMGLGRERSLSAVRISLSSRTQLSDVEYLLDHLVATASSLKTQIHVGG